VVDPNHDMNRFICESLTRGYRIAQAFTGSEGLRKALELTPDLILTDIVMPELNGDEMIGAIRSQRSLDRTPIIVLTAKAADDSSCLRLLREGAQDLMTKPFVVDELRARVANLIAAQKVRELEARLGSLVEQAPEGIFVANLDGRYIEVNSAACRLVGYTRDELIGKAITDLIRADDVERLAEEKATLLAGGVTVSEWKLCRKDGSVVPVEVTAKILPDGRWQGFARDITERKQLETALRSKSEDLERAQSVAQVGSWRLDIQHNVLQWSAEAYRIFETPSGTPMTYEGFLACVHPDDRQYVDRMWMAALRGAHYDIEHRLLVAGQVKWVRERAELEFDDHGALLGGIGITQDITERKRLESEIRQAQERFELALRGADLATWDWNLTSGEVQFNSRWAEMRGFRPDEITPKVDSWISGVHPDDWPHVQEVLDACLAGRISEYESEHRVRTRSGDWIWILDRGKVFTRNENGQPVRMVGTELDITARKRAEQELRLAHAVSSGISAISADAIVSVDDHQRITMFNEGAENIFGHSRKDAIGAPLDILIPERLRAEHRAMLERFASGPDTARRMGTQRTPIFGLRKDGTEFPADAAISRLEVGGKRILTVTVRDITEQKRIEHDQTFLADIGLVLTTSLDYEETLQRIASLAVRDVADICIIDIVGEGGDVHRVHAVCRDPARAWIGERFMNIDLDRKRTYLTAETVATNRALLIERVSDEQLAAIAQNDEHLQLLRAAQIKSMITVPLVVHARLVGAIGLISSTPERLYGPLDLQLAEELGRRAAFAIENARLYGVAQRAIRARDDVLGVVAHDLRNPLNYIGLQAEILRDRKAGEAIHRAAMRMNRLIQDLLDVTRMDSGRLTVGQARVSTRDLLAGVVDAQRPLAHAAKLELEVELPAGLPDVWADRDRLLQIFENLIGNALKFTKSGSITVGALPRDREVLFWVRDTGAGIAAEQLPHLFDRFWQGRPEERRRGAGLGLAIVKGLVEAHGGHIWVDSEVDRGSCFYFTMPTAVTPEQRDAAVEAHAP
jgi:PAS domain S-box-containing protein